MKDFLGFMTGSDSTGSYANLRKSDTIQNIEVAVLNIMKDPSTLTFLLEDESNLTKKYKVFQDDITIHLKINLNTLYVRMEKDSIVFYVFEYYRFIKKFNLNKYNRFFSNANSPVYDLIDYLSSFIWEADLENRNDQSKLLTKSDYINENEVLNKEIDLRSKINRLLARESTFLSIEEVHLLTRYKNDFLWKTLKAFKQLNDDSRNAHRSEVLNQFSRIEEKVTSIESSIEERKELVLLRQFHIMNQND